MAESRDEQVPLPGEADQASGLNIVQVEITQSVFLPPEYLRTLHAIDAELVRLVVEHHLASQDRLAEELFREQAHRRKLEGQDQKAEIEDRVWGRNLQGRGQWMALAVVAGGFSLSGLALGWGYESAAKWLGGTTLVALAAVFLFGRRLPEWSAKTFPPPDADTAGEP